MRKKSALLLVPEMELSKSKRSGFRSVVLKKKLANLKNDVGKAKTIGIDKNSISLYSYEKIKKIVKGRYKDMHDDLLKIRSVKDKKEIMKIKEACKIGDKIFRKIINNFRFRTEKEIANFIDMEIRKNGCEPSFPAIAASGKNSSIVHHNNEGKIEKGFLLLDFGVKYGGYCSDMSRTVYLGKPGKKEIEAYEKVLEVQKKTVKQLSIGKKCSEIDKFAREKLGKNFTHGLGHGVGLDIHESPNLLPDSKDILEKNHVVTVEPGIYFENKFGIRIEDTVIVTSKNESEILTKSKKNLISL